MPRDITLPAHWGRWQRLKNTIFYWAIRGLFGGVRLLPWRLTKVVALFLGSLAYILCHEHRRRAKEQLQQAFKERSLAEVTTICRQMFKHLLLLVAELTHIERFIAGPKAIKLTAAQRAILQEALAAKKGVVLVTGHLGNWEILGQVLVQQGFPLTCMAKKTYDPRLTALLEQERGRRGLKTIWRGDVTGAKEILKVFKSCGIFVVLLDQDTRVAGTFVPFFGRLAYTPTSAAALALKKQLPVLIAWTHRQGEEHFLHLERCSFAASGDLERDTVALTAHFTSRLEEGIRQAPEQWVWLHKRWHRQPPSQVDC